MLMKLPKRSLGRARFARRPVVAKDRPLVRKDPTVVQPQQFHDHCYQMCDMIPDQAEREQCVERCNM
jgi:hypothetical protein